MNRSVLLKLDESHGFTSIINIDPYLSFRIIRKMSSRSRVWLRFSPYPRARMPCEPHIPDTSLSGSCLERETYAADFYRQHMWRKELLRAPSQGSAHRAVPTLLAKNRQFLSVDARTKSETDTVDVIHIAILWVISLLRMVNTTLRRNTLFNP